MKSQQQQQKRCSLLILVEQFVEMSEVDVIISTEKEERLKVKDIKSLTEKIN